MDQAPGARTVARAPGKRNRRYYNRLLAGEQAWKPAPAHKKERCASTRPNRWRPRMESHHPRPVTENTEPGRIRAVGGEGRTHGGSPPLQGTSLS